MAEASRDMTFTENDKLKALAIVSIFETSRAFGDYGACVVLDDGAGVSYGISQFTHRSGSLAAVVDAYLNGGGQVGSEILAAALPALMRTSAAAIDALASDERFKKTLRAAAVTREMKDAQRHVAFERYLRPALQICEAKRFVLPLSLAVVYDSVTQGSWNKISRNAGKLPAFELRAGGQRSDEMTWVLGYVRKRHLWLTNIPRLRATSYRTKFFLDQIAVGNWELRLPMIVHGVRLTEQMLLSRTSGDAVQEPPRPPKGNPSRQKTSSGNPMRQPPEEESLDKPIVHASGSGLLSTVEDKFDRVESVVTGVATRTDSAKSLWTTVAGTIWQTVWAVFSFLTGLPREVWIVVAIIAAALMLTYLYRQIEMGKIREWRTGNLQTEN